MLNRPLTYREAHILIGSCVIPIVGGWLVNEAYNHHVLWAPDERAGETTSPDSATAQQEDDAVERRRIAAFDCE